MKAIARVWRFVVKSVRYFVSSFVIIFLMSVGYQMYSDRSEQAKQTAIHEQKMKTDPKYRAKIEAEAKTKENIAEFRRKRKERLAAERKAMTDREFAAIVICKQAVRKAANHPSTVSMDWGYDYTEYGDNEAYINWGFNAKNSFGLEIHSKAVCLFKNGKLINLSAVEG